MKPGFIIIVIIGIFLTLAILSSTGNSLSALRDRDERESSSPRISQPRNPSASETIIVSPNTSSFTELVTLRSGRARRDDPRDEYLEIRTDDDNPNPINITGWTLRSTKSRHKVTIGNVAILPRYPGNNAQNNNVLLEPGDRAYIISGVSPVKMSFRTNKCTGYFTENKDFTPRLKRQCPDPADENLEKYGLDSDPPKNSRDEDCLRAIKSVGTCEDPGSTDDELSRTCRDYLDSINYNWCASLHLKDSDFAGDEWYVYVGSKFNDIWDDDEDIIELRDTQNKIVDVIEY